VEIVEASVTATITSFFTRFPATLNNTTSPLIVSPTTAVIVIITIFLIVVIVVLSVLLVLLTLATVASLFISAAAT